MRMERKVKRARGSRASHPLQQLLQLEACWPSRMHAYS